jgi:hypothetical protein
MTPAERIEKAFDDAHVVIADYLEPGPRNAEATLNQLIRIIDDHELFDALVDVKDYVAAGEDLPKWHHKGESGLFGRRGHS